VSASPPDELPVDFISRLRDLAGQEAAELGDSVVDVEHLLLAATRDELGCVGALRTIGVDRRRLRDFVIFISGVNEARHANAESRPYQRTRKREPPDALSPAATWAPEATDVVRRSNAEAARDGRPVGPAHLLIACAPLVGYGPTANEMRRAFGLAVPVAPGRVAHRLPVPRRAGPLVLGGGGEKMAEAVRARLATAQASIVYVGAAYPLRRGLSRWTDDWTAGGHLVVDSGLYTRDDAGSDDVCRTIRAADVVLLAGGRPAVLYDNLAGTPALEALVAASNDAAVVVGTSGSAHVMGSTAINPYGHDGVETEPTLAWLADVVVSAHHRNTAEELANLRRWLWPAITAGPVLLVPEGGAVWVHPGWRRFEQLDPGVYGTGAKWWTSADQAPVPLGTHQVEAPPAAGPRSR
jgi:hypothetical protein